MVGRTEKTKRMVDRLREMHSDITVDGSFFVNLLLLLVANGPDRVQQLETQASTLEQNVLCDQTAGFIHQMSCLRKELNQISRYFTQLNDFASTLIENASERFDQMGLQKLNYFLRKVDVLREDLQIVREYVTQVSGCLSVAGSNGTKPCDEDVDGCDDGLFATVANYRLVWHEFHVYARASLGIWVSFRNRH